MVISAKVTLSDRVLGIDLGADDYITKPFEPLEAAAKVRAQLRRLNVTSPQTQAKSVITVGDISLDLDECCVIRNGVLHRSPDDIHGAYRRDHIKYEIR